MAEILIEEFEVGENMQFFPTSEPIGAILAVVLNDEPLVMKGDNHPIAGVFVPEAEEGDIVQVVYMIEDEEDDDEEDEFELQDQIIDLSDLHKENVADIETLATAVMELKADVLWLQLIVTARETLGIL